MKSDEQQAFKMICFLEVQKIIELSRSTVDRLERAGSFPKRKKLSPCQQGKAYWVESEVIAWAMPDE